MKEDELFTGVFTLPDPAEPERRQFGMVASSSDPMDKNGTVKISLRHKDTGISVELNESSLDIEMPEDRARVFARILQETLIRMTHLRELNHLGRLKKAFNERP